MIRGVGTIRYIDLEGGFYGLVTDDGKKYDPINLTEEFRQDGLRVRFSGKPKTDQVSFRMWGEIIELESIERI